MLLNIGNNISPGSNDATFSFFFFCYYSSDDQENHSLLIMRNNNITAVLFALL